MNLWQRKGFFRAFHLLATHIRFGVSAIEQDLQRVHAERGTPTLSAKRLREYNSAGKGAAKTMPKSRPHDELVEVLIDLYMDTPFPSNDHTNITWRSLLDKAGIDVEQA